MSANRDLYLKVWRKAFAEGSIEIRYSTRAEADRMRLNLYGAVRKYRQNPVLDPDLHTQLNAHEVVVEQRGALFYTVIRHSSLNPLVMAAASQLDLLSEPEPGPEDDLDAMGRRLLDAQGDIDGNS